MQQGIDTTLVRRCIASFERAMQGLESLENKDDIMHDIYRAACVKESELVLEQCGKLLRKRLAAWFASNRQADRLHLKDLFRHAARHDLLGIEAVERWLRYRDNRTNSAYYCGERFAEATLKLLPTFVEDARALVNVIDRKIDG